MSLRGKTALVGVAESDLGEVGPGFTPLDLVGQATLRALDDAGLDKSDVDGLFSASAYHHMPTLSVGEYLGIRPRYSDATSMGGSSFVSHLFHAAAAIDAGLCEVALITYGSTQRSGGGSLSYNHPGMYGLLLIVEAVRQLRGECGVRQAHEANIALVHGNGGVLSSQVTAILARSG